jgi:hypothetical protein
MTPIAVKLAIKELELLTSLAADQRIRRVHRAEAARTQIRRRRIEHGQSPCRAASVVAEFGVDLQSVFGRAETGQ